MSKQGKFLGVPYDWRPLTSQRLKSRIWNKKDHKLFAPRVFGWGYTINFYELLHHRKKLLTVIIALLIVFGIFIIPQMIKLKKAHSTFENYYAFRGCAQLIKRTSRYGFCKLPSGETIKIVGFHGKWYLDHDLPFCIGNICL